jgi:PAS domain S-box-containing protein
MNMEKSNPNVELEERLRFETLIADLSSKFVNVPAGEVDREIMDAQRHICELLDLDLLAFWQWLDEVPGSFALTHLYSAQEGPLPPGQLSQEDFPWVRRQLAAGRIIILASLNEMPAEAARDLESSRKLGIKSNLTLPLAVGGEQTIGAFCLNTTRAERDWPDALVKRLQLVAQIFANALARKRADQDLRESEARLNLATASAEVGLWELDCRTRVFWATGKARAIFGFSPDEIISIDRFEVSVHPDDWRFVRESLDRSVQAGAPVNVEYRIRPGDGRTRWISSRGLPHFTPSGELDRVTGVSIDITDRKNSEEALRASEARLMAGTDLAGLGYYEVDYGESKCFMDERFRNICGVPPDLQQGFQPLEFWMEHVHPDDLQSILDERQHLHDGKTDRISMEYRYLHPARVQKWLHHLARIAGRSATGGGVRTYGVIRDITDTKRLSERIQSAAEEWKTTFDSINDQVMILDRECRVTRLNAATARFLGLPPEKIIGSVCCNLLHGTDCPIDGCPSQKMFQTGLSSTLELFHAGSGKWLLFSTDPIKDDAGDIVGAVHVGRDITEAKRAEKETQELRDNLMHLTRVNTMSVLSGSLAHELNQPLGIILSNAQAAQEMLSQEPPDLAEVQAILSDIVAADRRAGEVIDRLRALLKPGHLSLQPLPLNEVIEEVLRLINADLIGRGVKVVRDLAPDLMPIAGDRVQLQQLVLNLILNGADAMAAYAPGKRRLYLQTILLHDRVRASVRDEGCGLPMNVEQLFQPFYTTKTQGLGMGLAICRSIVDAHRGRLWAEPHAEAGAVFHFELPIAGSQEEP